MSAPRPARILHLSDLHFGRQFQGAKWQQLRASAKGLAPDLVIVTGDLVNTPWFWMLKRARGELDRLGAELSPDAAVSEPCEVWAIAGNHDTRITGLLPVRWLLGVALASVVISGLFWWVGRITPPLPPWAHSMTDILASGFLAVTLTALLLRALVRSNLTHELGPKHFLTRAQVSRRIAIGIVPFDSASEGVSWARGRVSDESLSTFHKGMTDAQTQAGPKVNLLWIAAVHHHPLPLPYDDSAERMMAMDNAGAFMSELSKAGIRLVLHGHKHHQHFARIVVDPLKSRGSELAVLSAGTPTERRNSGAFWHGFNVIDVDSDGRVQISMYEGPPGGGAFELKSCLDLAPIEEQDRRRHAQDRLDIGTACERMLVVVAIGPYGDARFVREFRGVSTNVDALYELPGPFVAATSRGLVEAFVARSLCQWGPAVTLQHCGTPSLGKIDAKIKFGGSGLQKNDQPIDFMMEFYVNNAFALNQWQFECMYPKRDARDEGLEYMHIKVPKDIAVQELLIHVRFPEDVPLPHRIDVKQETGVGMTSHWGVVTRSCLVRIESQFVVQVRIPFPISDSVIALNWELRDNIYAAANSERERGIARSLMLRDGFGRLQRDQAPNELLELLANAELFARNELGEGVEHQPQAYDIALFVFDEPRKALRCVADTYEMGDPRRLGVYSYGLGTVGRAFKTGTNVAFRRPAYSPRERPWGYVMPDGSRVTDRNDVKEAVILGVPLAPQEAPDWPYAVLQVSTDDPSRRLKTADTASDQGVARYCGLVNALTPDFEAILAGMIKVEADHG